MARPKAAVADTAPKAIPNLDRKLSSKTARATLPVRAKPYCVNVAPKLALCYYRKPSGKPGRWAVRVETGRDEKNNPIRQYRAIALADDIASADGQIVLSYPQARIAAAKRPAAMKAASRLSVRDAIAAYIDALRASKGDKAADDAYSKLRRHVLCLDPKTGEPVKACDGLGDLEVAALTLTQLQRWRDGMVRRDKDDPDAERRSRDTANRVLSNLKAALNYIYNDDANGIATDKAWRALKGFKAVGGSRQDHFSEADVSRLIEKAREQENEFADLLEAGFYTGARYGELVVLDVRHFDAHRAQITIPSGKTGARFTTLTKEAVEFFKRIAKDKKPSDILLRRHDGARWGKSEQHRRMKEALKAADLPQTASFYALRHTHISRAIERGMPLTLIAENVGTSVKMIEKNYGKFIAQTRRDLVERYAPSLRVVEGLKNTTAA
jgi:integrase